MNRIYSSTADNTERAIKTFNADQWRLRATSFVDETFRVSGDADEVATILHSNLKLVKN